MVELTICGVNKIKRRYYIFLIILVIVSAFYTYKNSNSAAVDLSGNGLSVTYIDVGQGDSILLQTKGQNMLIDAGEKENKDVLKKLFSDRGVKKLDYVITTHPHSDHIGAMPYIIKKTDIGKIFMPKVSHTTSVYEDLLKEISKKGLKIESPKIGDSFSFGNAVCTILAPKNEEYKEINDYSIVLLLQFGENRFIFTGDAEEISEGEMCEGTISLKADVLKVGHHGSDTSSNDAFLNYVSPKFAVISCGEDNSYNHPNKKIVKRLEKRGITIYRTDKNGTITAVSDGKSIKWRIQK